MNFLNRFWSAWQWGKVTPTPSYINAYVNSNTPILVDTTNLLRPYFDCPHLHLVINKRAEMFSNMEIKLKDIKTDEYIKEHPVLELLKQPNPLQNQEEWLTQYSQYKDIFANNFIYTLKATSTSLPKVLWNLPSDQVKIVWTGKMFKQFDIMEIIDHYKLEWQGIETKYAVEDVIYKFENFDFGNMKGISKIENLTLPISNIIASLKSRNVIITEKGMFGILSNQAKDTSGAIPLSRDERKKVEEQLMKDKGLYSDKSHIIVTNSSLKWESMGFPMKDMAFFEEVEDDFATILGAYGIDRDIFPSTKGATFENKKQGLIATYQNSIQPEADDLMRTLTKNLGLNEQGLELEASYEYMPIFQEDKLQEEQADKMEIEKYKILYDSNIISAEAFAQMADVEYTGQKQ